MNKSTVIEYFGIQTAVAKALNISDQAVSQWQSTIPEWAALKLDRLTDGSLKYDATIYPKRRRAKHVE